MNHAALFSVQADAFLFHDLDCLVQRDFFVNLEKNIKDKGARAIQTFHGRRVLYMDDNLTNLIINKKVSVNDINILSPGVSLPLLTGAPGGSMYIKKNLFFDVGGFDPELFSGNAPEDAFFWEKVSVVDQIHTCDSPANEIFHMKHAITYNNPPDRNVMAFMYNIFREAPVCDKLKWLKAKRDLINKYYYV
ncbi:MAG: hypothetical protein AABY22_29300 [Nanoarchaeota archaeon]